jgi:long-chain acyl-CoA synthetase
MTEAALADAQPVHVLPVADRTAVALQIDDQIITWDLLEHRARKTARALDRCRPCATVAVLADNCVEWGEVLIGNARAGGRLVPVNWHLTAAEIVPLLLDSQADLLIVDPEHAGVGMEAAAEAGVELVLEIGSTYDAWRDAVSDEVLTERPSGTSMMFTGGTTGRSKGVNRLHDPGLVSHQPSRLKRRGRQLQMPLEGPSLVTTPVYHGMGFGLLELSLWLGKPTIMSRRFDPEQTLALIESHQIITAVMVPTQFVRLLKLTEHQRMQRDLSSLEWVLHTAAPCPPWAKQAMIDWFGPVIYEAYASTEGMGPSICDSQEWLARPGTVGRAAVGVEYRILDDGGAELPPGEVGTIYCRGGGAPPAYHGDDEKTAAMVRADGWFTVGDIGWLDNDGYLFLADRRVDLVISRGSNIYPAEIEGVLVEHPDVFDAAVFGIPHDDWGQEIMAVIEPAPSVDIESVDVDDIAAFLKSKLAQFKRPTRIEVTDSLPRESHGKLKKRLLRDPYWSPPSTNEGRPA